MECPAILNAEEIIKLKFSDLPGCIVSIKIEKKGVKSNSNSQPEFIYNYGEANYDCSSIEH